MTKEEAKIIQYAATGAHRFGDTSKLWDTCRDLLNKGLMVEITKEVSTRILPTPEALAQAWDVLDRDDNR